MTSQVNDLLESVLTQESKDPGPTWPQHTCVAWPSNTTFPELGLRGGKMGGLLDYLKYPS